MNCEKCNAEFDCSADYSCWCMDLPTVDVKLESNNCLCKKCLEETYDTQTRRTV